MRDRKHLFVLLALTALAGVASGKIRCHTCVSTVNELTCLLDPMNVPNGSPVTDCELGENTCCTITRQEYLEDPGNIVSFSRGCQKNCPPPRFDNMPDSTSRFYNTYCNTPLCNVGYGNKSLSDIGGGGGGGNNVIGPIPGENGVAGPVSLSLALLVPSLVMALRH